MTRPVVLTIAGYDPSGGAGVTADLRVIEASGCVGVSAITALTVQNTQGVQSVHPVDAAVLKAQLEAIFADIKIDAVKIGMLGGLPQLQAVLAILRRFDPPNIVLDPVLASTCGVPLVEADSMRALVTELIPLVDVVTPNLSEAVKLTGLPVFDPPTMEAAGRRLVDMGARAALVKGGHLRGDAVDVLVTADGATRQIPMQRIETPHTHGTGCFLSARIATGLALGMKLGAAVYVAKLHLAEGLHAPEIYGKGRGFPRALHGRNGHVSPTTQQRLAKIQGIYVLTDPDIRPGRTASQIVSAALNGGASAVQYRAKNVGVQEAVELARELVDLAHAKDAILIVNDRVDIAKACYADGVHLGPDDIDPCDANYQLDDGELIGVSVATVEEAAAAAPFASYFGVGAVYGSKTKLDAGAPIGVGRLREIKAAFPHIPIVAIGGINRDNIAAVRDTGVEAAAVVSAVIAADDMRAATAELVAIWNEGRGE